MFAVSGHGSFFKPEERERERERETVASNDKQVTGIYNVN